MTALMSDPVLRRTTAGTAPNVLLRQPSFWRRQRSFAGIIAAGGVACVLLAPYTYAPGDPWGLLTIAVQSLAVWGAVIVARALANLDVETALVAEIESAGSAYLVDLKSQRGTWVDLDRLEQTLLPNNPSVPPPAMIRLFQHVCKEARDRRFDSSINIIQPYREEALDDLFRLQSLQKIALWLGILGTFVGLLVALKSGKFGDLEGGAAFLGMIQKMFDGLFISFTASIAGLEVAVILGFLLLLLRKRQETYFSQMEGAAVTILSVARHSINRDDFLAEFTQVSAAVRELSQRVYEETQELAQQLKEVHGQVREQNQRIDTGLEKLATAGGQFDGFLTQIGDAQRQFMTDIRSIYDAVAFKDLGRTLEEGVKQAGREVSERFAQVTAQTSDQLLELNKSIASLRETAAAHSGEFGATVKGLSAGLAAATTENTQAIQVAYKQLQDEIARQGGGTRSVGTQVGQLSQRLSELNDTMGRLGYGAPRRRGVVEFLRSLLS